jgi:hypothetical protein
MEGLWEWIPVVGPMAEDFFEEEREIDKLRREITPNDEDLDPEGGNYETRERTHTRNNP